MSALLYITLEYPQSVYAKTRREGFSILETGDAADTVPSFEFLISNSQPGENFVLRNPQSLKAKRRNSEVETRNPKLINACTKLLEY